MRTFGRSGSLAMLLGWMCVPTAGAGALEILGPREVEEQFVVHYGPDAYLLVGDRQWELVTDPRSPLLSPLGDGSFHPVDPEIVAEAARLVSAPVEISGRILVLPYPRRETLQSSCEGGTIYLTPGIRETPVEHVHATTAHEIGHLVQQRYAPEGSRAWNEYLERRGLDGARFHPYAPHRDRPREIFAEDFRFLFGGDLANHSGTIENPDLPLPTAELAEWFRSALPALREPVAASAAPPPSVVPNPCRAAAGGVRVRFHASPGPGRAHGDVFDVGGRRVHTVTGSNVTSDAVEFRWNGRDGAGRPVPAGLYFLRWRENGAAGSARVHVLR